MTDEPKLTYFEDGNMTPRPLQPKGAGKLTYHNATSGKLVTVDANGLDLGTSRSQPSKLVINVDGRVVLTVRRDGEVFTADYDPEDLDAAATSFVEEVQRQLGKLS